MANAAEYPMNAAAPLPENPFLARTDVPRRRWLQPLRYIRFGWRTFRLLFARMLHPSAEIGWGCDVRQRFQLRVVESGQVRIGRGCILDHDMVIEVKGHLEIGARTIFGHHCTIAANESLIIGEDCLIAEMVSIRDHDHCFERLDIPVRDQGSVSAPVRIGRNVWIGAKATITKGVTIGENAIIGANAVVTRDIPPCAIAVGIPARVKRIRKV